MIGRLSIFKKSVILMGAGLMFWFAGEGAARAAGDESSTGVVHFGVVFLMFAVVLLAGKLGNIVEKYKQPAVIGELLAGVALGAASYYGLKSNYSGDVGVLGALSDAFHEVGAFIDDMRRSKIIAFVSSFGAMLLLLSIGLESNVKDLAKVGSSAARVAAIGVIAPFAAGVFLLGPIFFADESENTVLFLAASLVATSVGIPSSVLKGLKLTKTKAARTFLGATVIDDVVGLIILAVVSSLTKAEQQGIVSDQSVTELVIQKSLLSIGFLCGAIVIGGLIAPYVSRAFSRIHTGTGMKIGLVVAFALSFGYLAELFGLEPIIGAFAAGLLLDAVTFKDYADPDVVHDLKALEFEDPKDRQKVLRVINKHSHSHIEDLVNNIGMIFIPVFFVSIGLQVDFGSLLQPELYVVSFSIAIVAVLAKFAAGFAAKGDLNSKMLIGASMVPRGEVGLIFAATGRGLGALSDEVFSVIVMVVILTTFAAPPFINWVAARMAKEDSSS